MEVNLNEILETTSCSAIRCMLISQAMGSQYRTQKKKKFNVGNTLTVYPVLTNTYVSFYLHEKKSKDQQKVKKNV